MQFPILLIYWGVVLKLRSFSCGGVFFVSRAAVAAVAAVGFVVVLVAVEFLLVEF